MQEIIEYGTVEDIFEADKHHPYTVGLLGPSPRSMRKLTAGANRRVDA